MEDSDGLPLFAFQSLDYIPSGFSGILAPYIETTTGTMRAAAKLMRLGLAADDDGKEGGAPSTHQQIVCDLGCGDGYFRTDTYIHSPVRLHPPWCQFYTAAMHRYLEHNSLGPSNIGQINEDTNQKD
jgi:hypothetical protein